MLGASGVDIVGGHDIGSGRRKPKGEVDRLLRDDETTSCNVDEIEIDCELVKKYVGCYCENTERIVDV